MKAKKSKPHPAASAFKLWGAAHNSKSKSPLSHEQLFELWKTVSDEEKEKYKKEAEVDKKRYETEMEEWKLTQEVVEKTKGAKKERNKM